MDQEDYLLFNGYENIEDVSDLTEPRGDIEEDDIITCIFVWTTGVNKLYEFKDVFVEWIKSEGITNVSIIDEEKINLSVIPYDVINDFESHFAENYGSYNAGLSLSDYEDFCINKIEDKFSKDCETIKKLLPHYSFETEINKDRF